MKNLAASIKDRLLNHARHRGLPLNPVLEQFVLSRFLTRLSESEYSKRFILKGAQLFSLWADTPHRPTRDADFLSFGEPNVETLQRIFDNIGARPSDPPDGVEWQAATATTIREEQAYGGIRVKVTALLGSMRIPLQIDVGFGDAVTPAAREAKWENLLDFPPATLLVYPPETVVAEKLEAAVTLEMSNSRMKDFFDLHWLSQHMNFDSKTLEQAIRATFERRQTVLPAELPIPLTEQFSKRSEKRVQWNAFLRKSQLEAESFEQVISDIAAFLKPVLNGSLTNEIWHPQAGWTRQKQISGTAPSARS